jgi:hypothetical protein
MSDNMLVLECPSAFKPLALNFLGAVFPPEHLHDLYGEI